MKYTKEQYLDAYKITLREYEEDCHISLNDNCAKCKLVKYNSLNSQLDTCNLHCPESIHMIKNNDTFRVGCYHRKVRATSSYKPIMGYYKEALIEYHVEAIKYLETIKVFNFKRFQNKLYKLDSIIAKKHNL
jgi:hypothetical protein